MLLKNKKPFRVKSLLVLTGIVIILDFTFTLVGQSESYWRDYESVNEINPVAEYLLKIHPALFVLAILGYLLFCLLLIYALPRLLSLMVAITLFLWHTWGTFSWLIILLKRYFPTLSWYGGNVRWYTILIYYAFWGILAGFLLGKGMQDQKH